jgi:MFS family permease
LQQALTLNTLLLGVDFLLLPLFGWLSMHIEKDKMIFTAIFLGACLALPLFLLLEGASLWIAGGVRITLTVIGVCLAAPYHAWAMETAPPERRFMVCAMGAALGDRLIGASTPMAGLWLYHQTGWIASPAILLIASALLAGGALIHLKRQTLPQPE